MFPHLSTLGSQIAFLEQLSYVGIFIGIMLAGHVMPIPEDIFLVVAGYITALGYANLAIMIPIGIVSCFCVDTLFYILSRKGSSLVEKLERRMRNDVFEKYKKTMREKPFLVIFFSRFLTGFRFASPLVAGYVGIPWKKYLTYNAISAFFFAPTFILLGYFFSKKIEPVVTGVQTFRHMVVFLILLILGVSVLLFVRKKFFLSEKIKEGDIS